MGSQELTWTSCWTTATKTSWTLFRARLRREFSRGIKRKPIALLKELRKAKHATAYGEKPEAVKTHLRNMVIVPEMIGSVVGVYNGKQYISVEINPVHCENNYKK